MNVPALTLYYDGNCSLCRGLYRTLARNRYRLSACADGVCKMTGKP